MRHKTNFLINYITLFLMIISCSQTNNKQKNMMQNPNINSKNIVEEITKQVKRYDYEPRYFIKISQNWCFAEILVNDLPVYNNYVDEIVGMSVSINHCIFKSGIQKIKYRLYPVENNFDDNTSIEIRVIEYNNKNKEDGKEIIFHESNNEKMILKKSFYEYSYTFNATVPYTLNGFEETTNLEEITNKKENELKLIKKYESISKLYEIKNYDEIARISYNDMKNQFISEYNNYDIEDTWNELIDVYKNPTLKMEPIKDYKIVYYGNGHLVTLIHDSNDKRLKGKGLIWGKYLEEGKTKATFNNCLMYIPKGKTEFEVY
jgi:hypothetical protein